MTKAGPCRGISRATYQASLFVAAFAVVGMAAGVVVAAVFRHERFPDVVGNLMIAHVFAAIILWIPAVAVHWVILRLCRSGGRRRQAWRAWPSALLAVPANWAGIFLIVPQFERWFTYEQAPFFAVGAAIFLTNVSIAVAWALPPWASSQVRRGRPESRIPPSGTSNARQAPY